jgi:hypothetical protein
VARILGKEHSAILTRTIGFAEIGMTIWILSGVLPRFCAVVQILLIAAMNIIEIVLAPDLLLFGKGNGLLALLLMVNIFYNWLLPRQKMASNT